MIFTEVEAYKGVTLGGMNTNNLRYAGDTVLLTENQEDFQRVDDVSDWL